MSAPLTITYRNGFRDRLAFAAYHLPRNPVLLMINIGIFLFFTFAFVLPAALSLPSGHLVAKIITFVLVELLLAVVLILFLASITLLTMISRRNKPLSCQRTLTVSDEAFVTESEYGRSEARWSIVQKLTRTRSHVFIYVSQENAVLVPRRAFESAAQWEAFYEICRQKTNRVA
jgi:hypothetical protein